MRSSAARWCSATPAGSPARRATILHRDRRLGPARARRRDRARPLRAVRRRAACAAPDPQPMPSACDDGPFGRGTGGQLRYRVEVKGGQTETLWIAVAGSDNSPGEARGASPADAQAGAAARREVASSGGARRWSRVDAPGRPAAAGVDRVGEAEPRRPHPGRDDVDVGWTNEAHQWTPEGKVPKVSWIGAGFPDYPWLFATDGEYTAHANVTLGQFESIKDHMRALRDVPTCSTTAQAWSCTRWSPTARSGTARTPRPQPGRRADPTSTPTRSVKFPGAVALIWRWTGDDGSATRCSTSPPATSSTCGRSSTPTTTAGPRATATSS